MSVFKHRVLIERPIGEVFAFLHDPANDPLWQTSLVESKPSLRAIAGIAAWREAKR